MKKYVHKKLGFVAIEVMHPMSNYYKTKDYSIPKELIENSQDREEVVEKDWIENVIDGIIDELYESNILNKNVSLIDDNRDEKLKEIVKKYAPEQNKFTEEDVLNYYKKTSSPNIGSHYIKFSEIYVFLKEHNLLSSSDTNEM